ncbi:unnamed protein product [Dovyalis caffra]|uniref:Uncharacterized protein n=1 Tax=Dovyalis caffra TaxID=77055 RepID=A0AAV1R8U1_9ROSI|nr:unnamed protein product [Dovyalis caffra]
MEALCQEWERPSRNEKGILNEIDPIPAIAIEEFSQLKAPRCPSAPCSGRLLTHWIGKRDGKKTARAYGTQRKSDFGQGLPLPAPSGQVNSAPWIEDPREIDILLGSSSVPGTSVETGTSVTQPRAGPVNPEAADSSQTSGDPVASPGEEAGPANQTQRVVPYPYQPDEVIGGLCSLHRTSPFGERLQSLFRGHTNGSDSHRRPIRGQG